MKFYEELSKLRERVIACGGKDPGIVEQFKLSSLEFGKSSAGGESPLSAMIPGEDISSFEVKLQNYPETYISLCDEAIKQHIGIIDWIANVEGEGIEEIEMQVKRYADEANNLDSRFKQATKVQNEALDEILQKVRNVWSDRASFLTRIREMEGIQGGLRDRLDRTMHELNSEHEKINATKERKTSVETALQKAKKRLQELEARVASDEEKLKSSQATVKTYEAQMKKKGEEGDTRMKEMQKTIKNGEALIAKVEHQRDTLETR